MLRHSDSTAVAIGTGLRRPVYLVGVVIDQRVDVETRLRIANPPGQQRLAGRIAHLGPAGDGFVQLGLGHGRGPDGAGPVVVAVRVAQDHLGPVDDGPLQPAPRRRRGC